jgi:hypothetical protein
VFFSPAPACSSDDAIGVAALGCTRVERGPSARDVVGEARERRMAQDA